MSDIKVFELESRWDYLNLDAENLPEGSLLFRGKTDGWFLTNKKEVILQHNLGEELNHLLLYGQQKPKEWAKEFSTRTNVSKQLNRKLQDSLK